MRAVVFALGVLSIAPPARAQDADPPRASLAWSAPEGCISAPQLAAAVSSRLGRPAFVAPHDAELRLVGRLERADRVRATLVLETAAGDVVGRRELAGSSCEAVADSVAVVLAIMLNVRRADLPPPRAAPFVFEGRTSLSAGLALGILPRPGLETSASLTLGARGVSDLGVELAWLWTEPMAIAGGEIAINGVSARLAVHVAIVRTAELELAVRLAVGGGPMWGDIRGIEVDRDRPVSSFVEVRAGLRFAVRVAGPLWWHANAEIGALPVRSRFEVRTTAGASLGTVEAFWGVGVFSSGLSILFD
jgi:hypothetical protein